MARLTTLYSRLNVEHAALSTCQGFEWPLEVLERDVSALSELGGDLSALIHQVQKAGSHDRFNEERCGRALFLEDPEFHTLLEIAMLGALPDLPADFVSQASPSISPRRLHVKLARLYSQHAYKLWKKGNILLLPLSSIPLTVRVACGMNFNSPHWTPKPGCPEGRFLIDPSNTDAGVLPVNSGRLCT